MSAALEQSGMVGLLDERPGRRARRPPWSGFEDPCEVQLAEVFSFLLAEQPLHCSRAVGQ